MTTREILIAPPRGDRVREDVEPFLSAAAAAGMTGLLAVTASRSAQLVGDSAPSADYADWTGARFKHSLES